MARPILSWLPSADGFRDALRALPAGTEAASWAAIRSLANHDLDFVQCNALDRRAAQSIGVGPGPEPIRIALLGSATTEHLHAGIRVAGYRRGLRVEIFQPDFNQYRAALLDRRSALHDFAPNFVVFSLHAAHVLGGLDPAAGEADLRAAQDTALADLASLWEVARTELRATVIQQTVLPVFPELMGGNEHRLPGSPAAFVERFNAALREHADRHGVHLLSLDSAVRRDGLGAWHDPAMWHRAKQDIALPATPVYGDLVMRLVAAALGRSAKALVLDLDNTIWGGVIGDDGLDGIALGQNSAAGEAFVAVQRYAEALSRRGVILSVCSKNDEAVALRAFDEHPDMVLRRPHIACFVANWDDKATNLRRIAAELNIGLDALVFVDDNPFERELVRRELPMVAVPEVPEDPALVPDRLAAAGYFESVALTADDRERTRQYQDNRARRELSVGATNMEGYLRGLDMQLQWRPIGPVDLARATQLVNKTNQFNLMTRRHSEEELRTIAADPSGLALGFRLLDRFGDNGLIAVVLGAREGDAIRLDGWLMSCRVLGRAVEAATLSVVADEARARGAAALIGEYRETPKNGMVREHYSRLGFAPEAKNGGAGSRYRLELAGYAPPPLPMAIQRI